jgi:prepilin signal peptidase PulO-like enzyme (type II secretory pathway)
MNLTLAILILLGCLAGYLVNYLADVLPVDLKLTQPFCKNPDCHARIRWSDYFLLRRCQECNRAPAPRFILVLLVMIVFTTYLWLSPPVKMGFWLGFMIFIYLLLVGLIDFENRLVLGPLSLVGVGVCLLAGCVMRGWQATLLGAAAGFGIMSIFYVLGILFTRFRNLQLGNAGDGEEALGSGDVTLATLLGLLMGWPLIWLNLLMGFLLAGVFSLFMILVLVAIKKYRSLMVFIPFGPFFILTAFFLLYFLKLISVLLPAV